MLGGVAGEALLLSACPGEVELVVVADHEIRDGLAEGSCPGGVAVRADEKAVRGRGVDALELDGAHEGVAG